MSWHKNSIRFLNALTGFAFLGGCGSQYSAAQFNQNSSGVSITNGGNSLQSAISIGSTDPFDLNLITANAARVSVTATGNVGIGTTSPQWPLHVVSASSSALAIERDESTPNPVGLFFRRAYGSPSDPQPLNAGDSIGGIYFDGYEPTTGFSNGSANSADAYLNVAIDADAVPAQGNMPTFLRFATKPPASTILKERLRISSAGNVGIGTTAPTSALQVAGVSDAQTLRATASTPPIAGAGTEIMYGSGTGYLSAYDRTGGAYMPIRIRGSTVDLSIAGATKVLVNASGNVGIGTTVPQATLDVSGFARLRPYASAPVVCSSTTAGSLALTSQSTLCVCRASSSSWVSSVDGATACSW